VCSCARHHVYHVEDELRQYSYTFSCSDSTNNSQCVYHPAPLTKPRASPDRTVGASSLPASSSGTSPVRQQTTPISPPSMMPNAIIPDQPSNRSSAPAYSFPGSPGLPRTLGNARGVQMLSTASHRSPENYTSRDARTGFLGPTSYSAVYTENSGKPLVPRSNDHYIMRRQGLLDICTYG